METVNGTLDGQRVQLLVLDDPLPCGPCTACCTVLGVHEPGVLDKPNYQPCQHLCATGCGIYENRPKSCRDWTCYWKTGLLGDERRRPDKLGIVIDGTATAWRAWEVWPGAAKEPAARYVLEKLRKRTGCPVQVITEEYGRAAWGGTFDDLTEEQQEAVETNLLV